MKSAHRASFNFVNPLICRVVSSSDGCDSNAAGALIKFAELKEAPSALRPTLGIQLAPAPVGAVALLSVAPKESSRFAHAMIDHAVAYCHRELTLFRPKQQR